MNDHEKALAILDRDGWTQGKATNYITGAHCAMGCYQAVLDAEDGIVTSTSSPTQQAQRWDRLSRNYREFILAVGLKSDLSVSRLAQIHIDTAGDVIAYWNDSPDRIDADVREGFKKAAELHNELHSPSE